MSNRTFVGTIEQVGRKECRMIDIESLTREEQLELLEELWDRLSAAPSAIGLTDAQREELDRRLDELDREGPVGLPGDEVLRRLGGKAS
jgi:putative addiction module component (TIGR02574 family)